jgi:hypothetical protein
MTSSRLTEDPAILMGAFPTLSNQTQHHSAPSRSLASFTARLVIAACLTASVAYFVVRTIRWPLVNDSAQISYLCFLVDHGRAPYRDIPDMDMPGTYLLYLGVMHSLGEGALAWRIFDLSLLAAMAGGMLVIAWPYDWLGGLLAAALFALIHGRDGPGVPGERDQIMAILLIWACACLFLAFRRSQPRWLAGFGLFLAAAIFVKPLPVVFALVIPFVIQRARKEGVSTGNVLLCIIGGMLVPALAVLAFLLREHALTSFLYGVLHLEPYYSHLARLSAWQLITMLTIPSLSWLALLLMASVFVSRMWWNWECGILVSGMAVGLFSWFAQGKGSIYQRYPLYAFLLLWAGIQLTMALRGTRWSRSIGWAGLAFCAAIAPSYASRAAKGHWPMNYTDSLTANLHALGGSRLSGHVQCLATPGDCDTTLYDMKLVQATGLSYDYFIFGDSAQPAVDRIRERFWQKIHRNPPDVFVVSMSFTPIHIPGMAAYGQLDAWPQFADYLRSNYRLYADREFMHNPNMINPSGYRIYVRRGYVRGRNAPPALSNPNE